MLFVFAIFNAGLASEVFGVNHLTQKDYARIAARLKKDQEKDAKLQKRKLTLEEMLAARQEKEEKHKAKIWARLYKKQKQK